MQELLRKKTKIARALNDNLFTYKDIAQYLEINSHSFYNWLKGYYCLSEEKAKKLQDFLDDLS